MTKKTTKDFEGFEKNIYDENGGRRTVKTVGSGINVEEPHNKKLLPADVVSGKRGITEDEDTKVREANLKIAEEESRKYVGDGYDNLHEDAKGVLKDNFYNMGMPTMNKFKGYRKALKNKDYDRAADELQYRNADDKKEETPYYKQTKGRAKQHVETLRNIKNKQLEEELTRQLEN